MAFAIASGLSPEAGLYCAVVAGFLVSAARRFALPDRRADRRLRRRGRRHRRQVRHRRAVHVHAHGRRAARRSGHDRHGHGDPVHSASGRHRFHQRHRGPDRQHPDQGLLRPRNRQRPRRVSPPPAGAWPKTGRRSIRSPPAWRPSSLAFIVVMRRISSRIPGTVLALFGATAVCWALGFRSRPSSRASAAFPSGLPHVAHPAVPARSRY